MSKKIYRIFIILMLNIFLLGTLNLSYGYSGELNYEVAKWHSDFSTSEATDKNMKKWKSKLLSELKSTFDYDGDTIREKMAMKTKIYITDESKDKCTIRIRKRRCSRNWKNKKR